MPLQYPNATVGSYPRYAGEVLSDGTGSQIVTPYACSTKQYPVKASK